jgi:hypothetical protein
LQPAEQLAAPVLEGDAQQKDFNKLNDSVQVIDQAEQT